MLAAQRLAAERLIPADDAQKLLFRDPTPEKPAEPTAAPERSRGKPKPRVLRSPKPLDPSLPREKIAVPAPDLKELICPVTNKPMQPGFLEQIEMLARRAPEYFATAVVMLCTSLTGLGFSPAVYQSLTHESPR